MFRSSMTKLLFVALLGLVSGNTLAARELVTGTDAPTESPAPSPAPSAGATDAPTESPAPSPGPTSGPTANPTLSPAPTVSQAPTGAPSAAPTNSPAPTASPTAAPTAAAIKLTATEVNQAENIVAEYDYDGYMAGQTLDLFAASSGRRMLASASALGSAPADGTVSPDGNSIAGTVTYDASNTSPWPLPAGDYFIQVINADGSSTTITSAEFEILDVTCADDCAFSPDGSDAVFTSLCVQYTKSSKKGGSTTSYKNVCQEHTSTDSGFGPGDNLSENELVYQCGCCEGVTPAPKDEDFCGTPACTSGDSSFTVCKVEKSNQVKIDACVSKQSKKGATTTSNKCVDPFDSDIVNCGACAA